MKMNVVFCNIDGSLISGGLAVMWFKFRVHHKLGQGSFSANIHNPCLPCPECSQRNVNEVHFKCRGWGPRQCDRLSVVLGENRQGLISDMLSSRHRRRSKVRRCHSWQGEDWHCSSNTLMPVSSSSGLCLPEAGWDKGWDWWEGQLSVRSLLIIHTEGHFPFPWASSRRNNIHPSHGIRMVQSVQSIFICEHNKTISINGKCCPKLVHWLFACWFSWHKVQ